MRQIRPEVYGVDVPAMLVQVQQHAVHLLLLGEGCFDAALHQHSCLVQPTVGSGSAEQAALVVSCTALQHAQQAGVWQRQQ
jgi:hypothetical protein